MGFLASIPHLVLLRKLVKEQKEKHTSPTKVTGDFLHKFLNKT